MTEVSITPPQNVEQSEDDMKLITAARQTLDIFGDGSKLFTLLKKAATDATVEELEKSESNLGVGVGIKTHLIDKLVARELRDFNATHAICIDAKKSSSVGLGHRKREIHDVLDPLCTFSWQDTLDAAAEDFWETGECFIEVVLRDESDRRKITSLNHVESAQIHVEVEDETKPGQFHYEVQGEAAGAQMIIMAKWGDLEDLKARFGQAEDSDDELAEGDLPIVATRNANDIVQTDNGSATTGTIVSSEIIHIRQSTNRSRYYGYPDYMSAVPSIELVQCMTQHEFDFYYNRGVPEFILFLLGKNVGKCWPKIENLVKASQGPGNSHKTGGVHIPGNPQDTAVQVEKLAMEDAANSGFTEKSGTLDMRIATAHGMPPQLANIALPGKMGAANEGPNAMLTFQMRKLGQAQRNWSTVLARTLGSEDISFSQPTGEPKKLSADLFLGKGEGPLDDNGMPQFVQPGNGFATILDGMTLGAAQTMSEMREPMTGSNRNPEDGKLDGARDRKDDQTNATRGAGSGK